MHWATVLPGTKSPPVYTPELFLPLGQSTSGGGPATYCVWQGVGAADLTIKSFLFSELKIGPTYPLSLHSPKD